MSSLFIRSLPALLAWGTILGMFFFSWLVPAWVAIFIILFDLYWLLKTVYLSFHLHQTFREMKKNLKINWWERLRELPPDRRARLDRLYHLILLPFYQEPYEIIRASLASLAAANYSPEKFIVVLGVEERAGPTALVTARRLEREFKNTFAHFLVTIHPADLPGEIPGKGANTSWMAKAAKEKIIDPLKLSYADIITSSFDVDTYAYPDYFTVLSYHFLTATRPEHSSYQPIPLFINNIYDTPAFARVVSFSATFWQMMQQARPERLTTFSSHSMPFQALVEAGFWERDLVSEDSRIFWQLFFHYHGNWRVVPLNYPLAMDANQAPTFWRTLLNVYKQQRRWAWGVENTPYLIRGLLRDSTISWRTKFYWLFIDLEGRHSWSTNALMIFALGWLPLFLGGEHFNYSLLSYSLPEVTRFIVTLSMVGIASSAVISMALLPPKPSWFRPRHYLLYILQWLLIPVTLIIFGAFPGLDAQTRLALGGRFSLDFWVTPKYRLPKSSPR